MPPAFELPLDSADVLADLRHRFVARTRARIDLLREAVAADAPCGATIASIAHQLAGSAGTFGYVALGRAAAALEDAARAVAPSHGRSDPSLLRRCHHRLEAAFAILETSQPTLARG